MLRLRALVLAVLPFASAPGQVSPDSLRRATEAAAADALHDHLERGYITLPFPFSVGNAPRVWFEGSIVPHFVMYQSRRFAAVVTPKVVVRMVQGGSVPVRTPSYMPRIQVFGYRKDPTPDSSQFLTFAFSHYSNGQENDSLILADGSINTKDGNFSTYYAELGLFDIERENGMARSFFGTLQYFIPALTYEPLHGIYSPYRLRVGVFEEDAVLPGGVVITGLFGPSGGYLRRWYHRVGLWWSYYPHIAWLPREEITPYLEFYLGMDHYNVQFATYRSMVRLGLGTRTKRASSPLPPIH